MEEEDKSKIKTNALDELLKKYLSVWLWSILFGGATTITFSLANVSGYEKWGMLASVIGLLLVASIFFLIIAWMTLFQFLKHYLIAGIFLGIPEASEEHSKERAGKYLTMSFYALITAGIIRLMIELAKQIFQLI